MQTSGKSQLLTKVTKMYPGEYVIDVKDDRCLHGCILSPGSLSGRVVLQTQAGNFFFFFWLCLLAYGILVPRPVIKPVPPEAEAWSPNK